MSCLTTSQRYNRKHPHSLIPRAWQTTRPPHLRISKGMIHLHPLHPPSLRKLHKNSPSLLHQNFGKALHHHGDRTNGVILDTRPWDRRGSCAGKSCTPRRTQGQQASFLCGLGLWNLWSSLSQWEQRVSAAFSWKQHISALPASRNTPGKFVDSPPQKHRDPRCPGIKKRSKTTWVLFKPSVCRPFFTGRLIYRISKNGLW